MPVVKTSAKGQIVIPKEIREKLGITPGKRILLRLVDEHAEITPLPDDPIKRCVDS
jgi:AbrB family looped-hinge helix DNA binding protein